MSHYFFELSIIHIILVTGYWILLKGERQYSKKRFYLLTATALALVLPLLNLPMFSLFTNSVPEAATMVGIDAGAVVVEMAAVEEASDAKMYDLLVKQRDVLLGIYLVVSLVFLLRFFGGILKLINLKRNSTLEFFAGLKIRKIGSITGSFSFFHWIFINDGILQDQPDYEVIVQHERAHAWLGHSYDIVLLELFTVFFWWLPSSWIVLTEIRRIHEFQADAFVLKTHAVDQYSRVLVSSTLKSNGLNLVSSFNDGLTLKRLKAMRQQTKQVRVWKLGLLSGLVGLVFLVFACSEELSQEIQEIASQGNVISFDQLPPSMQEELKAVKDGLTFTMIKYRENGEAGPELESIQQMDPNLIHAIEVDETEGVVFVALKRDSDRFDEVARRTIVDGEIFTVVEELPEYEGGMEAFYKYVMSEIRYPAEARKAGVEGRVDVQFVVEKDGSLSEIKVVDGIGAGCDLEAVRVLQKAASFRPGRQRGKKIRVRMMVPIIFKLKEGSVNLDESAQGMIVVKKAELERDELTVKANFVNNEWSGTIYDEAGQVLPGANIVVAGTTTGTVSDLDGTFTVPALKTQQIVISFVGYESVWLSAK